MNRQFEVYLNKSLCATVHFNYEKETEGMAEFATYMLPYEDEDPGTNPSRMHTGSIRFYHGTFTSIDDIKKFDEDFFKKEIAHWISRYKEKDAVMTYAVEDIVYRYLVYNLRSNCVGLSTIRVNFLKNLKEMEFISTQDVRFDEKLSSHSLESNGAVFRRFFKDYLALFNGDDDYFYSFTEVCRWNY